MSAHTPGPWCLSKESKTIIVQDMSCIGCEGVLIGSSSSHPNSGYFPNEDEGIANARLIAAAPDLLAALYAVLHDCDDLDMVESNEPGRDKGPWLMANEAIAKAIRGAA